MRNVAFLVLVGAACAGCGDTVEEPSFPQGTTLWSRRIGHGSGQESIDVAVDPGGNTLAAGGFYGESDFGAGTVTTPAGNYQAFLVKYAPGGSHVWSKAYGDFLGSEATSVGVDASSNIYLAGYFTGAIDFGGGELKTKGSDDLFLAKLDASGNPAWSLSFGDANPQSHVTLAVDTKGNTTLFGEFYGVIDFGGGPLDGSNYPFFVARFDAAGNHVYSLKVEGVGYGDPAGAMDKAGNAYVTGHYDGTLTFGSGTPALTGDGGIFVAKLDAAGALTWVKGFGQAGSGSTDSAGMGIAVDPAGNVLVTGRVSGGIDFGGGLQPPHPDGSGYDSDPFILKLDAAGNYVWDRRFGGSSYDEGRDIAADRDGNVIVTGKFMEAMVVAGKQVTGAGLEDVFVLKVDANGNPIWGRGFGNDNRQSGLSLGVAADGAVLLGGAGYGPIDLGDGLKPASGYYEAFVGKFAP